MRKQNGFTLIELLAVIVVLAIIAIIAVPIILNVIENSKLGAAKESAVGYINAMEDSMVLNILNNQGSYAGTACNIDNTDKKKVTCENGQEITVKVKGTPLDSLYAIVTEKGYINKATWKQGNYCGTYDASTGSTAYKCSEFTIAAIDVAFQPTASEDADEEWKSVGNVQEALDYLYGIIG